MTNFPFRTIPCGSYAFGKETPESDRDYFIDISATYWLEENGFEFVSDSDYPEDNPSVIGIYRNLEKKIDLIQVKELYPYRVAMDQLLAWGKLYDFNKEQRSKIWSLVIQCIE